MLDFIQPYSDHLLMICSAVFAISLFPQVLDNCIGSGTTAIAALNTNRNFIGIEKEQKYVDIANKRIQEIPRSLDSFART